MDCFSCGRPLSDELSIKRGYGPYCYKKKQPKQKSFPFATQFPAKKTERRYKQRQK